MAANSVDSDQYVDGSIDTAHIANANVTQAKIADQAINEAKMQISNAPTNGYVLTAQSGNTGGLTWAEAGGGLYEQIATTGAISNVSSVVFANQFDANKYNDYLFIFANVRIANAGYVVYCQTSTDGGSNYAVTYGDYHRDGSGDQYGLAVANGLGPNKTGASGRFELYSPLDSGTSTGGLTLLSCDGSSSPSIGDFGYAFSGRNANEATNAVRFLAFSPASNITSGEITMYGIKKA
jgi:hypothetical protein